MSKFTQLDACEIPEARIARLVAMLLTVRDTSAAKQLLGKESETFRRIAVNLQRHAMRHEGRRSDLIMEEEWQAPQRALMLLAGYRNVQPRFGRQ
jgi:hypothetical protein